MLIGFRKEDASKILWEPWVPLVPLLGPNGSQVGNLAGHWDHLGLFEHLETPPLRTPWSRLGTLTTPWADWDNLGPLGYDGLRL